MGEILVDNITNKTGGAVEASSGVIVTGVTTATTFKGGVQATTGTFSGNLTVGGRVNYEDVTSVDSVGVITARSGIRVGAGESIGSDGAAVVYYGNGSNLSGVKSGVVDFVASGTITNGATVIINTDGTVSVVSQTTDSSTPSSGTPATFNTGNTNEPLAAYDSTNQKVVVVYNDDANSGKGTAVVGTVSGTSISFGSEVVFNAGYTPYVAVAFNSTNGKVVVAYRDQANNNDGTARVGTVSGTSISFGTATVFKSGQANYISMTSGESTDGSKVAITYQDGTGGDNGECVIGTISGTSISFGSPVTYESNRTFLSQTIYDTQNGRVFIFYKDGDTNQVKGIVGQISGTSITFGSATSAASTGQTVTATFCGSDGSGNGLVFAAWNDNVGSGLPQAAIGTIVGGSTNSISWGSVTTFGTASSYNYAAQYSATDSKVILIYGDYAGSVDTSVVTGTISGTSVSFGSPVAIYTEYAQWLKSAYDSTNNKVIPVIRDTTNSIGVSLVVSSSSFSTNLTAENYIGIAAEAISNGATGKVNIMGGVNSGQTGLTTARTYYVQPDGTLATSAGSPSVVAGTSISETQILIR